MICVVFVVFIAFNVLIDDTDTFSIAAFLHIHVFTCFY